MASTPDWTRLTPSRRLWELIVAAGRLQVRLPLLRNARNRKMPERAVDESASVPRTSRGEQAQHIQDRRWSLLCDAARSGHETRSPESAEFAAQIVAWLALTRAGYGEVAPAGNIAQRFLAGDIETAPAGEMMAEICVLAHELAGPLERGASTGDSPSTTKRRRPCDLRRCRAPDRSRTCDLRYRKPALYPLSYGGIRPAVSRRATGDSLAPPARAA